MVLVGFRFRVYLWQWTFPIWNKPLKLWNREVSALAFMTHFSVNSKNWMKNTLLFTYSTNLLVRANRKYEQLSNPQNRKMCDPILVTLLKMQHHYSQSSRENATPSSGTSPLASYKVGLHKQKKDTASTKKGKVSLQRRGGQRLKAVL